MSGKTNAAAIRLAKTQEHKELMSIVEDNSKNTSTKIRELFAIVNDKSTVAELLGKRFQHVRNVLNTQLTGKKTKEGAPRAMVAGDL